MAELSRFYGIVIKMYYNDHNPPHFYAEYGSSQMVIDITTLAVIGGRITPRATGLVMEWAAQHQEDLQCAWQQARNMQSLSSHQNERSADALYRVMTVGGTPDVVIRTARTWIFPCSQLIESFPADAGSVGHVTDAVSIGR